MRPNWFIGIPVPSDTWFDARVPTPPACTRRFHPADLHATVAFLGAVDERAARRAWAAIPSGQTRPVSARFDAVIPLGPKRAPSSLCASFAEGRDTLAGYIAARRDAALEAAGSRPDTRPPLPHVTLVRIQRRASPAQREHAIAWAATLDLRAAQVELTELALYTWSADRRHRLFRIVARRPL